MKLTTDFRRKMIIMLIEALKETPMFRTLKVDQLKEAVLNSEHQTFKLSKSKEEYIYFIQEKLKKIQFMSVPKNKPDSIYSDEVSPRQRRNISSYGERYCEEDRNVYGRKNISEMESSAKNIRDEINKRDALYYGRRQNISEIYHMSQDKAGNMRSVMETNDVARTNEDKYERTGPGIKLSGEDLVLKEDEYEYIEGKEEIVNMIQENEVFGRQDREDFFEDNAKKIKRGGFACGTDDMEPERKRENGSTGRKDVEDKNEDTQSQEREATMYSSSEGIEEKMKIVNKIDIEPHTSSKPKDGIPERLKTFLKEKDLFLKSVEDTSEWMRKVYESIESIEKELRIGMENKNLQKYLEILYMQRNYIDIPFLTVSEINVYLSECTETIDYMKLFERADAAYVERISKIDR